MSHTNNTPKREGEVHQAKQEGPVINVDHDHIFFNKIHRLGRMTVLMALLCFIGLAFALSWIQGIPFDVAAALKNGIPILLMFTIAGVIENLSFAPIIGCGALYMACITGNLSNMKAPAAISAMDASEHQPGTPQGDVISMIAVCASTLVTVSIVLAGMLFLAPIVAPIYHNAFLKPAFQNIVPALFGALLFPQIAKAPKQAAIAILCPVVIRLLTGPAFWSANSSYVMVGVIAVTVWSSWQMRRHGMI